MDNCAIHHAEECISVVNDTGALVQFLPPYSSKVRTVLMSLEMLSDDMDIDELILYSICYYYT